MFNALVSHGHLPLDVAVEGERNCRYVMAGGSRDGGRGEP